MKKPSEASDPKAALHLVVGILSAAAIAGSAWGLLYGLGALVTRGTILIGCKLSMWSLLDTGGDPGYVHVAFGFICTFLCMLGFIGLAYLVLDALGGFGKWILGLSRKRPTS